MLHHHIIVAIQLLYQRFQKWEFILNCCSDCPRMNDPYLESSEQLDRFFPSSLHKIKFHIFQNISKFLIHGLRPFKYKNTCDLCDNIKYKYKIGRIMAKKYLFFTRNL